MCYPKPCAIGRTYQPSIGTDHFYAIAAFTYAPNSLNAADQSGILDIDKLNTTAFEYCEKVGKYKKNHKSAKSKILSFDILKIILFSVFWVGCLCCFSCPVIFVPDEMRKTENLDLPSFFFFHVLFVFISFLPFGCGNILLIYYSQL